MHVLWTHGVNTGRLTMNEFVAVTSANTAKIFNIYPVKGLLLGSDADLAILTPRPLTQYPQKHIIKKLFNIFEGMEITVSTFPQSVRE
ncbi:MAG: hypothetical protein CM1200mP30_21020 [Pseudomonadota bacterium]|nr:MAG: hypothetical protein CM1200mP30_21020 [Pseudomonadota bacterium]